MPAQVRKAVYAFEHWEIDLAQRELRVRGVPVPIGGRAFEIVEAMVESAGELVTKDELMGRVWPGAVVEENTLQVHVSAVRKTLGPDRGLLRTASGRGYRLLGRWTDRPAARAANSDERAPAAPAAGGSTNLPLATYLKDRYRDQVRTVALDVTDGRAAGNAVRVAADAFGRLDVHVNNAGYGAAGSIEDTSDADFRA